METEEYVVRLERLSHSARVAGYVAALSDVIAYCTAELKKCDTSIIDSQELVPHLQVLREAVDERVKSF